ncbi:hypothetical protein LOTGIDRAFT_131290 [Lottia gigantea]|uniref:Fibrinogen C-terminal domain-containing protein n=1 Tax=Lottia gigantea TaxID=225164 RepID=V3Z318_LOTGI|nr:hypothetical protein LOTGIDRAFT_131290 [Lottia gigantea]ESO85003.1 hypothetical protein LOTGIDRAFT_131290 [Lottia gigantea]
MISFIKPLSYPGKPFEVLCIFDYGGYTTIHKREFLPGCTDFNRNWKDYRNGFGSMHTCFWLGLDKIYHVLQNNGVNDFRMDIHLKNDKGKTCQTDINLFNMGNEKTNYTVKIHSVNIVKDPWCDGMFTSLEPDDQPFTTYDHNSGNTDCINHEGSGWWFADDTECSYSNLNAKATNGNIIIKTNNGFVHIWSAIMQIRS